MLCVTTATFSVCVNGEIKGFFIPGRGLRQGDPISPYLFTLVMEVLTLMIKKQIRNEGRFKYHAHCKELELASLCFTDDLLLLCHGDLISAFVLRRGMDEFALSSSLYPSANKSNSFFGNVPKAIKNDIKLAMPFNEGSLPFRYLGVPMISKRLTS